MKTLRELKFLSPMVSIILLEFTTQVPGLKISVCSKDRVLMYINVGGVDKDDKPCAHELVLDKYYDDSRNITAVSKIASGIQVCTVKLLLEYWEELSKDVYGLEIVGLRNRAYRYMIECVRGLGINLYVWRKILEN